MRVFFTIVLGLVAIVAFCVFFGLHSVLSYVDSPAAVTETAKQQELHDLVLKAADTLLESEFRPPPGPRSEELRRFVMTEARAVFKRVLTSDWFYEALTISYTVVLAILHDREDKQVIELGGKKERLLRELDGIVDLVGARCREFIDDAVCDDEEGRRRAIAPVRRAIEDAIAHMPDRIYVYELAETAGQRGFRSDSPEMTRAREGHGVVSLVRYGALGALVLVLLFIALINRPLPRVLISVGAVLALASVTYLVCVAAAEDVSEQAMAESMAERASSRIPAQAESVRGIAAIGTEKLVLGAAHDSIHHADNTVIAIFALSGLSFFLGIVLRRRRRRAPSPPPRAVARMRNQSDSAMVFAAALSALISLGCVRPTDATRTATVATNSTPGATATPERAITTAMATHTQERSARVGVLLEELTWQQAEDVLSKDAIVVIPVGAAAKEHGPHLQLRNDWLIAEYFKQKVLERVEVVVAPTIGTHYYPAFREYPGSITLRLETARDVIIDVVESLAAFGPRRFYVLNTGVSTVKALAPAADALRGRGLLMAFTDLREVDKRVPAGLITQEGGTHADEEETSMMLVIAPDTVTMAKAVKDYDPRPLPGLTRKGPDVGKTYSPTGIYGDPTLATRAKGEQLVAAMLATILDDIDHLRSAPVPTVSDRSER